ncbi:MAG: HNH endonuclease [Selenomonadaceae bacterium]|nr:HNH endonuclease [Selenomonadaceae bacterium]
MDEIKLKLLRQPLYKRSIEYSDNRRSLYLAQKGKCAVTGKNFTFIEEIHCHHKIPKAKGGTDDYQNLILVTATIHKLIHATKAEQSKNTYKPVNPTLKSSMC